MKTRAEKKKARAAALPDLEHEALRWLIATGVGTVLPLVAELPLWTTLSFALVAAWRYGIDRWQWYRPRRLLRYALLGGLIAVTYMEFGTIFGRDPGVALLTGLLALKLLELRTRRDAMVTVFLFYVLLAGAFLFNQTLINGAVGIAVVALSLVALTRLQQKIPTPVAWRLTAELVLKAVPLLLVLYVLFPRMPGTLWGLPRDAYAGMTGMPDEIRPGTINHLVQSDGVAFRVDFYDEQIPPARDRYWRALVLWDTDGRTWRRDAPPSTTYSFAPLGPAVRYRVTAEPSNERWLFALDLPARAPAPLLMRGGFTLVAPRPLRERWSYDVTSHLRYDTGSLLSDERTRSLALPPLSARVRAFADELRARHASPEARVRAVLDHFHNESFVYTLTPPLLGDDPVDEFLFDTRRGFCEHYAAAFATLMRAAGVPARVVVGYQGGEINPAGNYLIVRQSDAHAWTEVWLPDRGWVRTDPTAAIAPERVELGLEAIRRLEEQGLVPGSVGSDILARTLELPWMERALRQLRFYWDYTNLAWYRWVVDYRDERQTRLLRALGFETIEWWRVWWILGGSCAAVLLAYVAWSRRVPPPDPAQRVYLRFCRKLARAGLARAAHEGPLAFAQRASHARPDLAPQILAVTERYLDIRYGTRVGNDELKALEKCVSAFRAIARS